jgi:asparagine synthase (glutamine-hydrolysing)
MLRFDGQPVQTWHMTSMADHAVRHMDEANHPDPKSAEHCWYGNHAALGYLPSGFRSSRGSAVLPWRDPQSGCVITADARIDNRAELVSSLGECNPCGQTASDSQLILLAYLRWGTDCLPKLLGDFAFAVWNETSQTLFCARDPVGARALTFVQQKDYFAFASNPEWMLGLPGVSSRPDPLAVAEYLVPSLQLPATRTAWREGAKALIAGEWLIIGTAQPLRIGRWWQPEPVETQHYASQDEAGEHFRILFSEATRCRAFSGERGAAVMMSGGIDSMAVSATLAALSQGTAPIRTYSAISEGAEGRIESRSILSLVESLGSEATLIQVPSLKGPIDLNGLIRVAWSRPHPVDNSLLMPSLLCLAAAQAHEASVLHGVSGDIVAGVRNPYFSDFIRSGRSRIAWKECRAASRNNVYLRHRNAYRMFAGAAANAWLAPGLLRPLRRLKRFGWIKETTAPPFRMAVLNKDLLAQLRHAESHAADANAPESVCPDSSSSGMNFTVLSSGMAGYGRIGRKFGIHVSDPWADLRVLQFFRSLPLEYKVHDGWTKYAVRSAFVDRVAPSVLWRRDKEHVGSQFTQLLLRETDEFVRDVLSDGLPSIADYVDAGAARDLVQRYDPELPNDGLQVVFELVTLILWSRQAI